MKAITITNGTLGAMAMARGFPLEISQVMGSASRTKFPFGTEVVRLNKTSADRGGHMPIWTLHGRKVLGSGGARGGPGFRSETSKRLPASKIHIKR